MKPGPSLHEIHDARHKESARLLAEYDNAVYYPALKDLYQRCVADGGHRRGKWHSNGFGWSWFYCSRCGGRMEITAPDGRREDDERANGIGKGEQA